MAGFMRTRTLRILLAFAPPARRGLGPNCENSRDRKDRGWTWESQRAGDDGPGDAQLMVTLPELIGSGDEVKLRTDLKDSEDAIRASKD